MIREAFSQILTAHMCDWGVLLLGVVGVPGTDERLDSIDVALFSKGELEVIPITHPALDVVVTLAEGTIHNKSELSAALSGLCDAENINREHSRRVWRCWLLETHLQSLDSDPVYGLLDLTEFWSQWGWPDDAPTSMKSDTVPSQSEYHSDSNYRHVIDEHVFWIEQEKAYLTSTQPRV
ncbi:DUF2247 family protein [[Empedobacter] haloabium]|uniref:DUF2247 family protein n=1 Tax=[Empedobacter] haloabium TaxID=592317 RepID=A0ABZ1UF42_9BURK